MITKFRGLAKIPYYGFFWKKQQMDEPVKEESKTDTSQVDEFKWKGKEHFLKELRQKREEFEKIKIKEQKEAHTQTIRQAREHEVLFGRVDYAKVLMDNINIQHQQKFQHVDELFYFISQLKTKLTEPNLISCVQSLIEMSDKLTEDDLIRYEYLEFQAILASHLRIVSQTNNLIEIVKLLDILCVPSENEIWKELEIVLLKRMNKFNLEELVSILTHLSNQREGTDQFWDYCENYLKGLLDKSQNKYNQSLQVMLAYWKVQRGTPKFINYLVKMVFTDTSDKDLNTVIQSTLMMNALHKKSGQELHVENQEFKQYFQQCENVILPQIESLKLDQICLAAQGFGFDFGSEKLLTKLEEQILKDFNYSLSELKLIMKSFLLTYRGSKKLIRLLMERTLALKHEFNIIELAQIVKAVYITENDDQQFYIEIERKIIQRLKEVRNLEVPEITEVAQSYLLTRLGSREFYKMLEMIINFRFDDIRQDGITLNKLHELYQKSALCDPKLLERMAAFL